jgi:hypothetical protein
MVPSFHTQAYRRAVIVSVLFCAAFVAIGYSLRPQNEKARADRLIRTASDQRPAN